ncbi:hypothetical protein C2G38_2033948 [Gigaspora rosea]|uniref:Uncharacterized protein n=1 Tax=Gigaspora rosea TaxID=44941 RepID=A0A397VS94_9GLOM|nr:hypothetical protein C2G38_2033948 [Gigaspora rosea]
MDTINEDYEKVHNEDELNPLTKKELTGCSSRRTAGPGLILATTKGQGPFGFQVALAFYGAWWLNLSCQALYRITRHCYWFIFALITLSILMLATLDIEKGKIDAKMFVKKDERNKK